MLLGLYYTTLCSKDTVGHIIKKILASNCINKGWSMNSDRSDPHIFLFRLNLLFSIKHYLFKDETNLCLGQTCLGLSWVQDLATSVWVLVAQSCPTLCDPMDCSPPGFPAHRIFQARIPKWVAIPFSNGSSWPRDRTPVSCIAGRFFTVWTTREAPSYK